MFKRIVLIKYIVLMSSVFGLNNSSSLTLNGFSSSGSEQAIRFSNPGYNLSNKTINGKQYLKPEIAGAGSKSDSG